LLNFQLAQIKVVNLELFPFGPLKVNLGKEQPVCNFVLVIKFIVLCDDVFAVLGQDVFGNLLEVCFEVVFEITQNVCLISLEMQF
jgi:hypothetical protein